MKQQKKYWENLILLDTPWATAPIKNLIDIPNHKTSHCKMLVTHFISLLHFGVECHSNMFCNHSPMFDYEMHDLHCKNCGVLCPPNEQHTIGVKSHRPLKACLAHLIWCARS